MIYSARKGFTLVELLVVAVIICLLAVTGIISYTSINTNARDSRRKADLEQIRVALEMYRTNNSTYNTGILLNCSFGSIKDVSNTYLSPIPKDPLCDTRSYYITFPSESDYTLSAALEGGSGVCSSFVGLCGGLNCNYCVGPYGIKP